MQPYSDVDCHWFQQQAIGRITNWLAMSAGSEPQHNAQFIESCNRMNRLGSITRGDNNPYCRNRSCLDLFMRTPVKRLFVSDSDAIRQQYKSNAGFLGVAADKECRSMQLNQSYRRTEPYFTFGH